MQRKSISFKYYLFFSFLFLSWLPVIGFAYWTYQSLVDGERAEVYERHLLTSKNVALALTRYARDVESAFRMSIAFMETDNPDLATGKSAMGHLEALGFRHVCLIGPDRRIETLHCVEQCTPGGIFDEGVWAAIADARQNAAAHPGSIAWSGVVKNRFGKPQIYLIAQTEDGKTAIGALTTSYLIDLQQSVRFGQKGHAAIVDKDGRVIAHPLSDWVAERRDLSQVKPVQAMMKGEAGVAEFFSPALQADMIAGYSVVSGTGWGIMVPQPLEELYAHAERIAWIAGQLALVAMCATGLISWLLARGLSGSLQPLLSVADRIGAGDLSARVGAQSFKGPREVMVVSTAVDEMMDRLATATRKQMEAYDQLDRTKSELLAHVSHELRTPLNAIIGFADIIHREVFGPIGTGRYIEYADDITKSGRHLLRLVDQLLEVARNDLSPPRVRIEQVDITPVVTGAVAIAAAASPGPRDWIREVADDLPQIIGDEQQLSQMMINVLENAGKYSEDGARILTRVALTPAGELMIRVEDSGIGMTEEELDACMIPFGRGSSPLVRTRKGAGLGLSVVASIVAAHDASIAIDSTPGKGTTVSIIFPKRRLADAALDDPDYTGAPV